MSTEDKKFTALLSLGKMLVIVGWIAVGLGGIIFLVGLAGCSGDSFSKIFGIMSLAIGLTTSILGFLIVAYGQSIECFVSIENNTHKTLKVMESLNEQQKEKDIKK